MKSFKLTPFVLFLILLLTLVIAMIFGYKSSQIMEGLSPASSGEVYPLYHASIELDSILVSPNVLFDQATGNIIIPGASTGYTLVNKNGVSTDETAVYTGVAPTSVVTPWSVEGPNPDNLNILYTDLSGSTLVMIIDPASNDIKSIFKNVKNGNASSLSIRADTKTGLSSTVLTTAPASYAKNATVDGTLTSITINGDKKDAMKIADDVFFDKTLGICVQTAAGVYESSTEYTTGFSKQVTSGKALVISTMVSDVVVVNMITKRTPSGTNPTYVLEASLQITKELIETSFAGPKISFDIKTPENKDGELLRDLVGLLKDKNGGANGSASTPVASSSKSSDTCTDPRFMLKTEVVPPVRPACPACPASSGCNLSINTNGEIVDCNGKKYTPAELYKAAGSSPATWAGAAASTADSIGGAVETGLTETGDVLGKTVDAAGNTITKTADTAGNVVTTTVDTAGNIVNKTIDTAGDLAKDVGGGVSDLASGIGSGLAGLGKGAAELISDAGSGAKDVVQDTGSGLMELAQNKNQGQQQQQQQGQQQGQQPQQQGQQPQPQQQQQGQQQQGYPHGHQQGYDYGYQQGGYSNYQTCSDQGSDYMPITNDFSQFT